MNNARNLGHLLFLLLALVATPRVARAQDDSSTTPQSGSTSTTSTQEPSSDITWSPLNGQTTTSSLDTGQSIDQANSVRVSPLHWGHLSLLSADVFYGYDSNYKFSSFDPQSSDALAARLLAFYSIGTEHTSFDLQYRPSVLVSTTGSEADVIGSAIALHTFRRIGSRWMLGAVDRLSYAPDRDRFIDETISPNFSTGDIQQQSFLLNGFNEFREYANAILSYRLTFRDTISFHGQYEYADLTKAFEIDEPRQNEFNTTNTLGGGASWTHALSTYHEIGATYNYDRVFVAGIPGSTEFNSFLFTYGQWFGPTLRLWAEAGPSIGIYGGKRPDYTTILGSISVTKMFHDARLAVLYSRDYNYVGLPTNNFHDRVDGFYSRNFGPRWELSGGGGYLRANPASNSQIVDLGLNPQIRGRNLWVRAMHNLNPRWGLYVSYANAAAGQPTASRNFVTAGVHWAPETEK